MSQNQNKNSENIFFKGKSFSKLEFLEPSGKIKKSENDSLKFSKISTKIDQSLLNMSNYDDSYQIEEKVRFKINF